MSKKILYFKSSKENKSLEEFDKDLEKEEEENEY